MHRRLLSLPVLLALLAVSALAQFSSNSQPGVRLGGKSFTDLYAGQKILLSNYCRLDFEGARLQPEGWNRFKPFTTLRTNPEFVRIVVVTRFDIEGSERPSEDRYVSYQAVGYYQEGEGYVAVSGNDRLEFHIQEQNDDLLVTDIQPRSPHVSPRAAVAWMTLRLSDPKTTDVERAHLKDAQEQLKKYLPQSHSTTTP
jgi:hypothetical protein